MNLFVLIKMAQNSNMTHHFVRFLFLSKQKLSETFKTLLNSEIGRQLRVIWDEKTCFIAHEGDMLKFINNRSYEHIFNDKEPVTESILCETKNLEVNAVKTSDVITNEYYEFLDNATLKDDQLYPKDEITNKEKMFYVCLQGLYNYDHKKFITNTLLTNFYFKKASVKVQEMHNIHLRVKPNVLKYHYFMNDVDNKNREIATQYVNLKDLEVIVKEVVRNLLESPPFDSKCLPNNLPTIEPTQLLLAVLKRENNKVEDNKESNFDKSFLSCLNRMHLLYLLQRCEKKKLAKNLINEDMIESANNGTNKTLILNKFASLTSFCGSTYNLSKIFTSVVTAKNNFFNMLISKLCLIDYSIRNVFRDDSISHVIKSLLGITHTNCSRIDYDDIIQRKLILDVNREVFDNLEKQLKDIKIIDKVDQDRNEEDDNEIKFQNVQLDMRNGRFMIFLKRRFSTSIKETRNGKLYHELPYYLKKKVYSKIINPRVLNTRSTNKKRCKRYQFKIERIISK